MLNANQKKFRKEIEKLRKSPVQKNEVEVYSYIEDKHITNYYPNKKEKKGWFFIFLKVIMYIFLSIAVLLGIVLLIVGSPVVSSLIFILFLMVVLLLIFGLINPKLIAFGKSRFRLLGVLTPLLVICIFLLGATTQTSLKTLNTGNKQREKTIIFNKSTSDPSVLMKKELTIGQYKEKAEKIPYLDLARNPNKFKQKKIVYKGKVIQVMESKNNFQLRVNVNRADPSKGDGIILVNYQKVDNENRILDNDVITFWGEVKGLTSYKTIHGTEVYLPEINAKYLNIEVNVKVK